MARPKRADIYAYGEKKKQWQFTLTETTSLIIDEVAERLGITRSEVIERAARCGGLDAAEKFDPEAGESQE